VSKLPLNTNGGPTPVTLNKHELETPVEPAPSAIPYQPSLKRSVRSEGPDWQRLLLLTLTIEAASVSQDWIEFGQLCHRRSQELAAFSKMGAKPEPEILKRIQEVDARILSIMSVRKRSIGQELRRLTNFRKTINGGNPLI